jgi:hypothetical protein
MFGPKLKHRIFSSLLFCLAAAVLGNVMLEIYEQGTVTFKTVSGFGAVLFVLSIAIIPEFAFLKLADAFKVRRKSRREKISERFLYSGMVMVCIGFMGRFLL